MGAIDSLGLVGVPRIRRRQKYVDLFEPRELRNPVLPFSLLTNGKYQHLFGMSNPQTLVDLYLKRREYFALP